MRQVEAEFQAWRAKRKLARAAIKAAMESGDFADVPALPYAGEEEGEFGYPVSAEMEAKMLEAWRSLGNAQLNTNDQIGLSLQVNNLSAFRRSFSAQRQSKREMLRHVAFELTQADKYEALLLQVVSGTAKVVNLPAAA